MSREKARCAQCRTILNRPASGHVEFCTELCQQKWEMDRTRLALGMLVLRRPAKTRA